MKHELYRNYRLRDDDINHYAALKEESQHLVCIYNHSHHCAFFIGASIPEICGYINSGLGKTRDLMFIIFFSLPYFSVMSEAGLFDIMVEFLS